MIWWRFGRVNRPPIGELKLTFTLDLVLQAVDRSAACDEIWLAVRASRRGRGRESDPLVPSSVVSFVFGLLAVIAPARSTSSSSRCLGGPRRDADAGPRSSPNTGGGTATRRRGGARANRS